MPLYSIEIYHNDQARFMPYEPGQRLTLTVTHTLPLAECAPEYLADWAYEVFNLDLDHLGTGRTAPTGETAFLAACVYRLLGYRSLSVGDVVHIGHPRRGTARRRQGVPAPASTTRRAMTREMSKAAIDALPEEELYRVTSAFGFMKACAASAGVPHAQSWRLHYDSERVWAWRVIDRDADSGGSDDTRNVVFTLQHGSPAGLRVEMEAYGKALRGIKELRDKGFSLDLMAASRR